MEIQIAIYGRAINSDDQLCAYLDANTLDVHFQTLDVDKQVIDHIYLLQFLVVWSKH